MHHALKRQGAGGCRCGYSLMEAVLAIGVLAVVLPWVMLALGGAVKAVGFRRVDVMAMRVVPACVSEWQRSEVPDVVFAFGADGSILGCVDAKGYGDGLRDYGAVPVFGLCRVEELGPEELVGGGLRRVRVSLEHPSSAGYGHRRRLVFHTLRS